MAFCKKVGGYDVVIPTNCTLSTSMTITGQSVAVTGVTANCTVIVAPAPDSQDVWTAAGIKCSAQGANTLTFTAQSAPTANVNVNVLIMAGANA